MQQGKTERAIIEMHIRNRQPLPAAIANAPELWLGLELYYESFLHLTTCRSHGNGTEGPISWLVIDEYADRRRLSQEQRASLHYLIPQMDEVYLEHKAKKLAAATAAQQGKQ